MKKTIFHFMLLFITTSAYSQTNDTLYHYSFQIVGIDNIASAKNITTELRLVIGEKLITFNGSTDIFLLKSHQLFIEEELHTLIESIGFEIID